MMVNTMMTKQIEIAHLNILGMAFNVTTKILKSMRNNITLINS